MLTPKQLETLPNPLLELYAQVEADIIADMASRIAVNLDFIPAAEWQFKKLIEMGKLHDDILKRLSKALGISKKEVERLMKDAGVKTIESDNKIYRRAGKDPPVLDSSPALQSVLQAGIDNTNGLFENLTRTTANTATKQFEDALDRAWLQINSGAFDYNTAIRTAIKDLADKGVAAITYPSGHTDYLDTAVRRAIVTGANQASLKMQGTLAEEMETDLVEVTAHAGARNTGTGPANHASWQGKIYSRSGNHPKYPSLREVTGYGTGEGLGGWNCRHNLLPIFEGMDPVYTQEELDDMNAPKYEYNGRKLTEYEAMQRQRYIERQIRKYKREYVGMEAAGQPTGEAASYIAKWQGIQKDFLKQTGLKRQHGREAVPKFEKADAAKARGQAKRVENVAIKKRSEYNIKREEILREIKSDSTVKTLNPGNQNKHIQGHKGYIPGRSYIYGDSQIAQALADKYSGTGEIRLNNKGDWTNKEFIELDYDIGVHVNPKTGAETPTNRFSIHYGRKGRHIVPAKRRDK